MFHIPITTIYIWLQELFIFSNPQVVVLTFDTSLKAIMPELVRVPALVHLPYVLLILKKLTIQNKGGSEKFPSFCTSHVKLPKHTIMII